MDIFSFSEKIAHLFSALIWICTILYHSTMRVWHTHVKISCGYFDLTNANESANFREKIGKLHVNQRRSFRIYDSINQYISMICIGTKTLYRVGASWTLTLTLSRDYQKRENLGKIGDTRGFNFYNKNGICISCTRRFIRFTIFCTLCCTQYIHC